MRRSVLRPPGPFPAGKTGECVRGAPLNPHRAEDKAVAIYHLHVKNIGRREGRSAVAAAAYRAGETLPNEGEERESAFGGRRDVMFTAIILPAGAPVWMADRARLWNAAEAAEKRKDARLAKEIEFALPRELPPALWAEVAREMAEVYASRGHVVDLAIHDGNGDNPHAHMMLTTRAIEGDGFGGKMREADSKAFVAEARALWARLANVALGKVGAGVQIDARSHAARALPEQPTRHRGPDANERRARRWARGEGRAMDDGRDQELPGKNNQAQDYLVPDPDGRLITPESLDEAEAAMLREAEQPTQSPVAQGSEVERRQAEEAIDRLNAVPVSDLEAMAAYRVATPQQNMDWWRTGSKPEAEPALERDWPWERER